MTEIELSAAPERAFAAMEHRDLARGIDRIHDAGMLEGTHHELSVAVLDVLHWVDAVLEPHAEWEDRWLYPEMDRRAGTRWATRVMSFEHGQIRDLARVVSDKRACMQDAPTRSHILAVRARLFALEAVLRAHMEREERLLMPALEADASPNDIGRTG